jgi:magnesium-protoporphyrin O-methyltransferase
VDASTAYLKAAKAEASRRGLAERISFRYGDFVDLATGIAPADIVTLDRVICCYHDMDTLVSLSAERARKLYGVVYPRDAWWVKLGLAVLNLFFRLRKSCYRTYSHPTKAVEALVEGSGFERRSSRQTFVWQVVVYTR